MMWGEMYNAYKQLGLGYPASADISRIGHLAHAGFTGKRVMGYRRAMTKTVLCTNRKPTETQPEPTLR
jgi:hypothetical protein